MIAKNILKLFLFSLLFITVFSFENSFALPSDKNQPIHVVTGSALWNGNANTTTLINNVVIIQGTTKITADKLVLYADKNNKVIKAVATGELATYSTITDPAKPRLNAIAETIEYYPPAGQVNLIGKAKVTQGQNSMTAPTIQYNLNKQLVNMPPTNQGKVTIVVMPQQVSQASQDNKKGMVKKNNSNNNM